MIWFMALFGFLLALPPAQAQQPLGMQFFAVTEIAFKKKFNNTTIGGLSGIFFDNVEKKLFAVSDDKGIDDEPRFYTFSLQIEKEKISLLPESVVFIKNHAFSSIDMEGITQLPWGNFLISTEGDNNKKPRIPPQILDVKKDGTIVRDFAIPAQFIPEKTGMQKKGIRNNRGFEGLTRSPSGKFIWLTHESPLAQEDMTSRVHILQYEMPDAWQLKHTKEFIYPLEQPSDALFHGIGAILGLSDSELVVLERSASLKNKGIDYRVKLYYFDLKTLSKKLLYDFSKLGHKQENFEGLSWGPSVQVKGQDKRSLLVISDDNFNKSEKTLLLMFLLDKASE